MSLRILITERLALYDRTPDELEIYPEELCRAVNVHYDHESGLGRWDGKHNTKWYEWEVEDPDGERRWLVQKEYVPLRSFLSYRWYLCLLDFVLLLATLYLYLVPGGRVPASVLEAIYPSPDTVGWLLIFLSIGTVIGVLGAIKIFTNVPGQTELTRAPNPLLDDRHRSKGYEEFHVSWTEKYETMFVFVVVAVGVVTSNWRITGGGFATYTIFLGVKVVLAAAGRTGWFIEPQKWVRAANVLPRLGVRYLQTTAIITAPVGTVAAITLLGPDWLPVVILEPVLAGAVLWLAAVVFRLIDEKYLPVAIHDFSDNPARQAHPIGNGIVVGGCIAINVVLAGSLLVSWVPGVLVSSSSSSLFLSKLTATAFALTIPLGSLYQYVKYVRTVEDYFERSEPHDSDINGVTFETQVRRYDGRELEARAVETGERAAIVISERVFEAFTEEEVAALAAHEEGHLEAGDAILIHRLTLASSLLMIGRNVLFDFVDFYSRELAADAYAVEKTDPEWLKSALDTWQDASKTDDDRLESLLDRVTARESYGLSAIGPTLTQSEKGTRLEALLDDKLMLFYSGFTLQAHPDVEERKENIDEADSRPRRSSGAPPESDI